MNEVQFPTLKSMFPDYHTAGAIFSKMPNAPWNAVNAGLHMDIAYLSSFSGIKPPAMLPFDFVVNDVLDQQGLADTLWALFGHNWQKLWDAYMSTYDPLQNYKVSDETVREEVIDRDIVRDGTVNYTDDGTVKTENDLTTTVNAKDDTTTRYGHKIESDQTASSYTYGFNDATRTPTGVVVTNGSEVHSGEDTVNDVSSATTANTGTVTVTSHDEADTKTHNKSDEDVKDNETIKRDRSGNIGQNTYQELLRQEFELWRWNFYLQVFADCDRFLVLPYFGSFCSQIMSRFNTVN